MATLKCSRCQLEKEAVTNTAFYAGEIKEKLLANACTDCWDEWIKMQIMIINEYRLNLMDPKTDEFLNMQVLSFFNLDEGKQASVEYVPPEGT
jgi:Fe-S cluster biosynthesis and repair protein YggX